MSYKRVLLPVILLVITVGCIIFLLRPTADAPPLAVRPAEIQSEPVPEVSEVPPAVFDKNKYSINEPGSLWQIVNKQRALPNGYVPADLIVPDVRLRLAATHEQMKFHAVAGPDLIAMFNAAKAEAVTLVFGSGYRSYALQKQFYDGYVARDGRAAADRYSARPGTSEHQLGLSFDVTSLSQKCHLEICFENTPEGQWVKARAHEYGFIFSYPNGKESVTGYQYEPWHLRYVGPDLAAELKKANQTLEEFFDF